MFSVNENSKLISTQETQELGIKFIQLKISIKGSRIFDPSTGTLHIFRNNLQPNFFLTFEDIYKKEFYRKKVFF